MKLGFLAALAASSLALGAQAQEVGGGYRAPLIPLKTALYHTTFVKLGSNSIDGMLYEPEGAAGPKGRLAIVYSYPTPNFEFTPAPELASRGYRVLMIRHYGEDTSPLDGGDEVSRGVAYMRKLPGVERVIVMGHSGGGRMIAGYANIALNGPSGCQQREVIYPCRTEQVAGWSKPDGVILLDPPPGAPQGLSGIDPAYSPKGRIAALDMYNPANGYDPKTGSAHYSAAFIKRWSEAQAMRADAYVKKAIARLKAIESGKGDFSDDEPFVIPGANNGLGIPRLYQNDLSLQEHTKKPFMLLKADGSNSVQIIHTTRPATGLRDSRGVGTLSRGAYNTTVRRFLANYAARVTKDFVLTSDDIVGIDWRSTNRSTPGSAEGITVPTLIVTMGCNDLIVPGEITYDHLAAKDKTLVTVEGAAHQFNPCKPEYGNTQKRTFDFVDGWLAKPGRF